jgi:uroporphyrinogen decarboxylase
MRQAGRYLPEYKTTRKTAGSFLDLCYNSNLASEVTLQPLKRFDFDAAIIFSDILVILDALGIEVSFKENIGPVIEKFNPDKVKDYKINNIEKHLAPVYKAIALTKEKLPKNKPLIGFAGAPWTLYTYLVEGRGSKDFSIAKKTALENEALRQQIFDILVNAISEHLILQIKAGADIVQIFDSWAGILTDEQFLNWSIKPTKEIINKVKHAYPDVKIIGFPKGAADNYENYIVGTGVDAVGIDYTYPIEKAANLALKHNIAIQGNLDPAYLLLEDQKPLEKQIKRILDATKNVPHIFNLGHGILPTTPIANVEFLVDIVRNEIK